MYYGNHPYFQNAREEQAETFREEAARLVTAHLTPRVLRGQHVRADGTIETYQREA